jgi:DNA-binding transcriptional regulator/RsmH inhibitor MraZ
MTGKSNRATNSVQLRFLQKRQVHQPTAVEFDEAGRIIVVDSARHRLQIYQQVVE